MPVSQTNWSSLSAAVLDLFLVLGIQALILVLLACLLEYACRTAQEKRRLWQGVIVILGSLIILEFMGIGAWIQPYMSRSSPAPQFRESTPSTDQALPVAGRDTIPSQGASDSIVLNTPSIITVKQSGLVLGAIWLIGSCLFFLGLIIVHMLLWHIRHRLLPLMIPGLTAHIRLLANKLGVPKPIRVGYRSSTQTPYVFGIWQPTLVLPRDLPASLTAQHRDAVFVHELAHLAGRDPLWQLCCDLLVAMLWWHPAVWLLRIRWRHTAETVADEATTLFTDGPFYLAESLLAWQHQLAWWRPGLAALPFSSSRLKQRIRHLLSFAPVSVNHTRQRLFYRWVRTSLLVIVVMVVMISTSHARLHSVKKEEPMLNSKVLRHSVLGLAFLAATESVAPAQARVFQAGPGAARSVVAAGKSEEGAVLAMGLNQEELATFRALQEEKEKKMVVFRQAGNGAERIEAGKTLGDWYRKSLQSSLSAEQYSRYLEYWQFNQVAIKFDKEPGQGSYQVSVSPHPFDQESNLFKDFGLNVEQNKKITTLRSDLAKSYASMNSLVNDPKALGEFDALVAKSQKQRNDQLKSILTPEQYQKYRQSLDAVIQTNMAMRSAAGPARLAAPVK